MKFGGTSVGDVAAFEGVLHIISSQMKKKPVVVVSAMTGVTDALLGSFDKAKKDEYYTAVAELEPLLERHVQVAKHFIPAGATISFDTELQFAREELCDLLMRATRRSLPLAMLKDAIVSYGEQLSSRLLTEVFKANGINARHVDARRLIVTDDEFGAAHPIVDETNEIVRLELEAIIGAGEIPV